VLTGLVALASKGPVNLARGARFHRAFREWASACAAFESHDLRVGLEAIGGNERLVVVDSVGEVKSKDG